MTRLVRRPIQVDRREKGLPLGFQDGKVHHRVQMVLDQWIEVGEWWNGEGRKQVWRVWTNQGGLFDLECSKDEQWFIYRIWD